MSSGGLFHNQRVLRLGYTVALLTLAAMVLGSFVHLGMDTDELALFRQMIDGTARRPFIYRALVPLTVRALCSAIPESVREDIDDYVRGRYRDTKVWTKINIESMGFTDFSVTMLVLYVSIIGFGLAVAMFARSLYTVDTRFLYLLSLIAVAGLPAFFRVYSHIYDFTHLFLFTVCLSLLARAKWLAYLVLLGIATVSKETSVLLILVFVLAYRSILRRPSFASLLVLQVLIYSAIRLLISSAYAGSPGVLVEFHLDHNLYLSAYPVSQFVAFIVIGVAIAYDWKSKPRFLRLSLWIIVPIVLLAFFLGFLDEYRAFLEVYPIVLLLAAHAVARVLSVQLLEARR